MNKKPSFRCPHCKKLFKIKNLPTYFLAKDVYKELIDLKCPYCGKIVKKNSMEGINQEIKSKLLHDTLKDIFEFAKQIKKFKKNNIPMPSGLKSKRNRMIQELFEMDLKPKEISRIFNIAESTVYSILD